MTKIIAAIKKIRDKIVAYEPAWLPDKRKAVIPPVAGSVTATVVTFVTDVGLKLSDLEVMLIGGGVLAVVTGLLTWLVPNKPSA